MDHLKGMQSGEGDSCRTIKSEDRQQNVKELQKLRCVRYKGIISSGRSLVLIDEYDSFHL